MKRLFPTFLSITLGLSFLFTTVSANVSASTQAPAAAEGEQQLPLGKMPTIAPGTALPGETAQVLQPAHPQSSYVSVKLHEPANAVALQQVLDNFDTKFVRQNLYTGVVTLRVPSYAVPLDWVGLMAKDPRVEWAEEVKWRRLTTPPLAALTPNDTLYGQNQKWYLDLVNAPDSWGIETGKSSVIIAILDSGVMCTHPESQSKIWANLREISGNAKDDDNNGYVDDVNGYDFVGAETGQEPDFTGNPPDLPGDGDPCIRMGDPALGNGIDDDGNGVADDGVSHGTFVAGVAAAASNNSLGIAGMCWTCTIMPVRVANPEGWVRSSDVADGVTYAATNGAKIINLSLGGPELSQAEQVAYNLAINQFGALIVAAAGNENHSPIDYPAQLSNVLAVGASGHTNTKGRASFSNWGSGAAGDRTVDVVAPGVDIASIAVVSVAGQASGGGAAGSAIYLSGSGTSFSAPLVAGIAGLLLSRNPSLSPAQLRNILKQTATPLGDDPSDSPNAGPNWAGAGLVNALAALNATGQAPTPTPTNTPAPTATATSVSASPTPTPTNTPLPANSPPRPLAPASGAALSNLGTTLRWNIPLGATQYQVQVIPVNNDGPAINLIRNIETSYTVEEPIFGAGPYVMLPGMTYTWRVRATTATVGLDENSPLWGPWSQDFTFRTRSASSQGIALISPLNASTVSTLTPGLQWSDTDRNVFYYEIQVSKDLNFGALGPFASVYWELRHGGATAPLDSYTIPGGFPLESKTNYFWRVRPRIQGDGTPVAWSSTFKFTTR